MPTYEYRCSDCGHQFETYRGIDEEPLTVCERCGGRLRKVFHPAGIVFKGSGFYATDSRTKSGTKDGGDAKKTESKSDGSSDSKSGSRSDPKPDSKSGGDGSSTKESAPSGKGDSTGSKESS